MLAVRAGHAPESAPPQLERAFASLPIRVGTGAEADLRLAGTGMRRLPSFSIESPDGEQIWLRSRSGHMVNGVETRRRRLKEAGGEVMGSGGARLVALRVCVDKFSHEGKGSSGLSIVAGNGLRIEVACGFDAATLEQLVVSLRGLG